MTDEEIVRAANDWCVQLMPIVKQLNKASRSDADCSKQAVHSLREAFFYLSRFAETLQDACVYARNSIEKNNDIRRRQGLPIFRIVKERT